jgi:hypothetical protein
MSSEIEQHETVEVFVGVDVGKGTHHAVALDRKGKRLLDSALPPLAGAPMPRGARGSISLPMRSRSCCRPPGKSAGTARAIEP